MGKHRIRFRSRWTGKLDGQEVTMKAGDEADVPIDHVQALVYRHGKAELVPLEELIAKAKEEAVKAKEPEQESNKPKASRTRAKPAPKDKMVKTAPKDKMVNSHD